MEARESLLRSALAAALLTCCLLLVSGSPAQADNCTDNARPCSPRCIHLGNLYDHRNQAVERVYRKLERNSRQLNSALERNPVNQPRVKRLERRDAYLRKLYHRRHVRLMRTYRRLLRTCF